MVVVYRATASADLVSSKAIGSTTRRDGMTRSSSMATSAWMDLQHVDNLLWREDLAVEADHQRPVAGCRFGDPAVLGRIEQGLHRDRVEVQPQVEFHLAVLDDDEPVTCVPVGDGRTACGGGRSAMTASICSLRSLCLAPCGRRVGRNFLLVLDQ